MGHWVNDYVFSYEERNNMNQNDGRGNVPRHTGSEMSKREYMAALIMSGLATRLSMDYEHSQAMYEEVADLSIGLADAIIRKVRNG